MQTRSVAQDGSLSHWFCQCLWPDICFGTWCFLHFWPRGPGATAYQLIPCSVYSWRMAQEYISTFQECTVGHLESAYSKDQNVFIFTRKCWCLLSGCQTTILCEFSLRFNWQLLRHREPFVAEMRMKGPQCLIHSYFIFWIKSWLPQSDLCSIEEIKCFGNS